MTDQLSVELGQAGLTLAIEDQNSVDHVEEGIGEQEYVVVVLVGYRPSRSGNSDAVQTIATVSSAALCKRAIGSRSSNVRNASH